jgi:YVTN family beta-propeller protein
MGVSSASAAAVVNTITVGSDPDGVSSDGTHVWVTNYNGGTVSEIDASTGTVVNTIRVRGFNHPAGGVSSDGTHVWVTNGGDGTVSEIQISNGCVVPKLTGRTLAAAKTALKQADCAVGKITKRKSSTVSTGRVISSSPKAGSEHKAGTKVALTVSRGKH